MTSTGSRVTAAQNITDQCLTVRKGHTGTVVAYVDGAVLVDWDGIDTICDYGDGCDWVRASQVTS